MIQIIKQEIPFEDSLKKRLEMKKTSIFFKIAKSVIEKDDIER